MLFKTYEFRGLLKAPLLYPEAEFHRLCPAAHWRRAVHEHLCVRVAQSVAIRSPAATSTSE